MYELEQEQPKQDPDVTLDISSMRVVHRIVADFADNCYSYVKEVYEEQVQTFIQFGKIVAWDHDDDLQRIMKNSMRKFVEGQFRQNQCKVIKVKPHRRMLTGDVEYTWMNYHCTTHLEELQTEHSGCRAAAREYRAAIIEHKFCGGKYN